jgi:integrase
VIAQLLLVSYEGLQSAQSPLEWWVAGRDRDEDACARVASTPDHLYMADLAVIAPTHGSVRDRVMALVLDSVRSEHSRRAYARALDDFFSWYEVNAVSIFNKSSVQQYRSELERRGLSAATINLRLSAVRKLAAEAADNGLLESELAGGIARVRGTAGGGVRTGNWLTTDQTERLLSLPDANTNKGRRDRVIIALLVGCGLRQAELAQSELEQIQLRAGRWVIVDLKGKGARVRTVPMPSWAKPLIESWTQSAGITSGRILRQVSKSDRVHGSSLSTQSVFRIVHGYGIDLKLEIAPHDLRRTFAHLAHRGHAPIEQVQLSLGHASLTATERYLGVRQDLADAPCDRLGLSVHAGSCGS